ncbi:hypothetical protein [Hydrogenophaga sp. BPS33]|uniref:hypothetical protein n=1 Tax=Hydrogenophaga sp. BPS33 TaxID=2651974 RepID=UPI00132022CB|nr:hypothetical protein [Hydrogenophaga sp. BPS33]QHE89209.1 hypothetical protein F9K07_29935 [Hydrogenophaga sp. BPS33]
MKGIRLRHLAFTGPNIEPAKLNFVDGLNIVYGASNTGKSFASEAVLFMLGAVKELPTNDEIKPYDAVWLGVTLGEDGDFTLYRPTAGGNLKLFPGLISSHPTGKGEVLKWRHKEKAADTASYRILDALGLHDRWIVRNAGSGEKEQLSIRILAKYAVVGEEDIMSKRSPVLLSGNHPDRTLEQNLFKLLLTGQDDAAVVKIPTETERVAAKAGKLELIDDMLAQLDKQLGVESRDRAEAERQLSALQATGATTTAELQAVQTALDQCAAERREALDHRQSLSMRAAELDVTLERFTKLQAVYSSDLDRLHSIEEGGSLLAAMAERDCPVCGAPHGAQKHQHAAKEIYMAHTAAAAEARKIEREQRELSHVIDSLRSEALGLAASISSLDDDIEEFDRNAFGLRPTEIALRVNFEVFNAQRAELGKVIELHLRHETLISRRAAIEATSTKSERGSLPVGPDSSTVFGFGETIKAVLIAWGFPDADKVQFDTKINDITVAGKARGANGKGVRAVLHAAFNVAIAIHCIDKGLPHPGFIVLDTPLLTYREPLRSRHGELSEDEKALKSSSLAEKFYRHLASLEGKLQVIVLENADPPAEIEDLAFIEVFTGVPGDGRHGLLAALDL